MESKGLEPKISGWLDETNARRETATTFIKKYLIESSTESNLPVEQRPRYDSLTEVHFSGQNTTVMRKMFKGEAPILRINALYDNEKITQIHVEFDSLGEGHIIDVYLTGRALKDYLTQEHTIT